MGSGSVPGGVLAAPRGLLLDLDGTVYTSGAAVPGAREAIVALRQAGVPLRFVTNTTRRSRRLLVERLAAYGIEVDAGTIFTAVLAGASVLRQRRVTRIAPFVAAAALEDLARFEFSGRPEAVVVGDLGEGWDFAALNQAFRHLMDGAELVALQRDRYWQADDGLALDAGPFVAALEYAAGRQAVVCGKPTPAFFAAAVGGLGLPPEAVAMVGDDLVADVQGAQQAGLQGWLVRTGKFRPEAVAQSGVRPDRMLDSLADLPSLLGCD